MTNGDIEVNGKRVDATSLAEFTTFFQIVEWINELHTSIMNRYAVDFMQLSFAKVFGDEYAADLDKRWMQLLQEGENEE